MKKLVKSSLVFGCLYLSTVNASDLTSVYNNFKNGNYVKVIELLDVKKQSDKKFLSTKYYLKGISYSRLQDYQSAIENFTLAVRNKSKSADLYYELGQAFYAQNELEQARKSFFRSAKNGFQKAQCNYYIGHISQLLDEHKNAKKFFAKILKDKTASESISQIARFQLAESLLHMAREKKEAIIYVKKYILPQMKKALSINKKSSTAKDITKRISEIEREFGLDPNLLVNGKRIPAKRLSINFSQSVAYDNNFTLTNDLPGNQQSQMDTYIFETSASTSYKYIYKRRYIIEPGLEIDNTLHSDRQEATIYSSDQYSITPSLDTSLAHKAFGKPAKLIFNIDYEYTAKDRESTKTKIFNNRTISFDLGDKFKYFSVGDTTVKLGRDLFRSYDESLDTDKNTFSIDQLIIKNKNIFVALYQRDATTFINDETNDTVSNLIRVDYIRPEIFPKINFNLGISNTWLTYEDPTKTETRGTETTLATTFKLTKTVSRLVSVDLDYTYTKNTSELEDNNYTKHVTKFDFSINY